MFDIPAYSNPYSVTGWQVTGVPLDGELVEAEGFCYRFPASLWDVTTLPHMPFTTIRTCANLGNIPPAVWRSNAVRRGAVIALETVSDARLKSMSSEAHACWSQFSEDIKKRISWMHLIGAHRDIQDRMASPLASYLVEVRTLQDDFLPRMFAQGSADIALQAEKLKAILDLPLNTRPKPECCSFQEFLWPGRNELPSWAADRYAEALNGNFKTMHYTPAS
ncbi:MAG: hypothetical protein M0Q93_00055 [Terrimicrobiaceae bacterium]|jgi:hypothetical protein|nr:hypothetical protein [Terrimicrobiaceae bacterium]